MAKLLCLLTALLATPSLALPKTKNYIADPSFESIPSKDLNHRRITGGSWTSSGDVVFLSNAQSPNSITPYGKIFTRFEYIPPPRSAERFKPGIISQAPIKLPTANATYIHTFALRVTEAPENSDLCVFSAYYSYDVPGGHGHVEDVQIAQVPIYSNASGENPVGWNEYHAVFKASRGKDSSIDYALDCPKGVQPWRVDLDNLSLRQK